MTDIRDCYTGLLYVTATEGEVICEYLHEPIGENRATSRRSVFVEM
jgi:hypothetical protein